MPPVLPSGAQTRLPCCASIISSIISQNNVGLILTERKYLHVGINPNAASLDREQPCARPVSKEPFRFAQRRDHQCVASCKQRAWRTAGQKRIGRTDRGLGDCLVVTAGLAVSNPGGFVIRAYEVG